MAKFVYIATARGGKTVRDEIDAQNEREVLQFLSSRGLQPLSVTAVQSRFSFKDLGFFGNHITFDDKIFLSRYLSLMLKTGTNLLQAVNILIEDIGRPSVKDFLIEVRSRLERGQPFYLTFARRERDFGKVYASLIKAGEASGNLEQVLDHLSDSLVKEKQFRDQVKHALLYPILLLTSSFFILFFLVTFVLPKIARVFLEGGFQPPLFSRIVFSIGLFFGTYGLYLLILGFLVLGGLVFMYRTFLSFRRTVGNLIREIPIVRMLIRKIAVQRFAVTMASLIRAGMSLTDALEITAEVVGYAEFQEALLRISREGIQKGLTVGEAFRREDIFPQTVVSLVAISEKAGHIEEVLETLGGFYASEVDSAIKTLLAFLEPLLLLFIGTFIGFVALAVLIPIFQLTSQF